MRSRLFTLGLIVGLVSCSSGSPSATVLPQAGKRSEGRLGMVSSSQQQATQAGVRVLRAGGNAVDAAVAVAFSLSVTDPSQTGLGGGGAATVWMAENRRMDHLSFYGQSGESPDWLVTDTMPRTQDRAGRGAATPGMVEGLLTLHDRYGKLSRADVMAPAIELARDGFLVSPLLSRTISSAQERVRSEPEAAALFMPKGQALAPGERLVQPQLASLLELISVAGKDAFYRSAFATRLSEHVRSRGGLITVDDLAGYKSVWLRPLCTGWRGYTVIGAPPPMGGAVVLEMLNLAEASGITSAGSYTSNPEVAATLAQLIRIAQIDGQRWRGDPSALSVPARGLSSKAFAAQRVSLLSTNVSDSVKFGDPWGSDNSPESEECQGLDAWGPSDQSRTSSGNSNEGNVEFSTGSDEDSSFTSHLSVVDADGNAVSMTTTVGVLFGSGVWSDGVWLNSVGWNFDERTRGNHRYSNSTMSPTMVLDGGKVRLVVGAAGSQYIQPSITQVTMRMLAYGEDPGIALAAPRLHPTWSSRTVEVEPGFTSDVYGGLVERGFRPYSRIGDILFGGVHAVYVAPNGMRIGAADPRRDGFAAAQ